MLTVGSDIPYPPFEQGDPPDYEGFDIDLINAVAEEMGLETEIAGRAVRRHPRRQRRPLRPLDRGDDDQPARENRVDFSDPYFESVAVACWSGRRRDRHRSTTSRPTRSSAPRTAPPARPTPTTTPMRRGARVPLDRRRLQRARHRPGRRGHQRPAGVAPTPSRDKEGLEIVEKFPTDELYGIVIPEDSPLVERRQRGAADRQG